MLHGIPENKDEKTDDLCLATINEHPELSITEGDIERTHLIGKLRDSGQKSRTIIVKFVWYNDRNNLFNRKKKPKEKNIAITKSLTATRMKILFKDGSGKASLFYD